MTARRKIADLPTGRQASRNDKEITKSVQSAKSVDKEKN